MTTKAPSNRATLTSLSRPQRQCTDKALIPIARMFVKVMGARPIIRSQNRMRTIPLGSPITHDSCSRLKPVYQCRPSIGRLGR